MFHPKRPTDILRALRSGRSDLRNCNPLPYQQVCGQVYAGHSQPFERSPSNQFRLIKSTPPPLREVQRDGDHQHRV